MLAVVSKSNDEVNIEDFDHDVLTTGKSKKIVEECERTLHSLATSSCLLLVAP
jgi:hypothetical protein